jgi:hypothetical protein
VSTKPPAHPLDPHLTQLAADLRRIADDLRWAHADAWWPATHDPLEPSSRSGSRDTDPVDERAADPDHVTASRYDLGMGGDDITRRCVEQVAQQLRLIEFRLAAAIWTANTRAQQPALHKPAGTSPLDELETTITACIWRATAIRDDVAQLGHATRSAVRHHVKLAARSSGRAVRELDTAMSRGETGGVAHAEPKCRICEIRPQAQREHQVRQANGSRATVTRASKGGRCDTCSQYFSRNGNERPRALDQDNVDDALAAAGRRRARGEGWGSG